MSRLTYRNERGKAGDLPLSCYLHIRRAVRSEDMSGGHRVQAWLKEGAGIGRGFLRGEDLCRAEEDFVIHDSSCKAGCGCLLSERFGLCRISV